MEPELALLAEAARSLAIGEWSPTRARAAVAAPDLVAAWWSTIVDLGWSGVLVPDEGGDVRAAVILAGELGRVLAPGLFDSCAVAGMAAVTQLPPATSAPIIQGVQDGTATVTVALAGPDGRCGADALGVEASRRRGGWVLSGCSGWVPDAERASLIVVAARSNDDVLLAPVAADTDGVEIRSRPALDRTRSFGRVELAGVTVDADVVGQGVRAYDAVVDHAALALSADAVGVAEEMLHRTVEHAKRRIQFGKPIGSFQAVKHACADMYLEVLAGRAAVDGAARALVAGSASREVSIAKATAGDGAANVTAEAIQLHGGIGFTWEHDAHLFLKRARLDQALFGDSRWHRRRIALGGQAPSIAGRS